MFENCTSLDDLKRAYRILAMQNHPDHGGSTVIMQDINERYSQAVKHYSRYGNIPKADRRKAAYTRATNARLTMPYQSLPACQVSPLS